MKAKLTTQWSYYCTTIPEGTEVKIIKGMEADAAGVLNAPYGMCYLCEYEGSTHYIPATYLTITDYSNVDWEARRYELAKEYSKELIRLQHHKGKTETGYIIPNVVEWSVELADALIDELKRNNNDK